MTGVYPRGTAGPLVGRAAELAAIRAFLDVAGSGGGALLLTGEPGMGKSALLDVAARMAPAAGMSLLRVSGVQAETDLPFSTLNQMLIALPECRRQLDERDRDALSVALGLRPGPAPSRQAVVSATLALLRRAGRDRPLLIVLDDVQWIDRASAGILASVARRLGGSRAGLLAAVCFAQKGSFECFGLPRQELRPLPDHAAAELVATRFPAIATPVLRRLLAESRGNPLSLLELPEVLSAAQLGGEQPLPAALPLSHRLRAVFASRLAGTPAGARRLLLLAALEGTGELDVLLAAADADPGRGSAADSLAELTEADDELAHLDRARHRLTFRHPLVRSAVIEASTGSERQSAHRMLAGVLLDHPERRAWHLAGAVASPDEAVAAVLEQVAHRSFDRGDSAGAVAALLRAADLSPDGRQRSRRLSDAAYLEAGPAGTPRTASDLLAQARRAAPGQDRSLHAVVAAALLLLNGDGDVETATRMLVAAIAEHGEPLDGGDGELIDALHHLLEFCVYGARPELWDCFHRLVARLRPAAPAGLRLLVATLADPVRTAVPVRAELDAAIEALDQYAGPLRTARIGLAALSVDRMEGCRDAMWRVVRHAREGAAPASALPILAQLCIDDFFTGRWTELTVITQDGLDLSSRPGHGSGRWPFLAVRAALAAVRGDYDLARGVTDDMIGWATPRGADSLLLLGHYVRGLAAMGRGDFEEAYRQASAISPAGEIPSHGRTAPWVTLDLVESAVRTGRHAAAAAHVAAVRRARVAELSPRAALLAKAAEAVAAASGELFRQALAVPGASRWPFEYARVQLAYGEQLRRARATIAAREHLHTARLAFDRLEARPWATRAASELRAAGGGQEAGRTDPPPVPGLTPQEREVVLLAAAGLSNQQIAQRLLISRRTVDAHLYRAFPKLGIKTRAALRDALDAWVHRGRRD